mmetsp:Transcript_13097/g.24481  ORF Transcript_13097/g.24481 Transcript_13097/m.24481 type:complete len:123 (+) Transcript_13097:1405-1773(+)
MKSSLPSASELLSKSADPSFLKGAHRRRVSVKSSTSAQIVKGPVVNPSEYNSIDQYDYFASTQDAILDHWNAPQEITDAETPNDFRKLQKIHDTRRKAVLGLKKPRGMPPPTKRAKAEEEED